ncbi:type IV pilus assembly protein PilO [Deinobacterium chartae]|uniref:Type IV pilus assembly protein PilO n=1 Tax=Deinobacterium chartae TaxID=521158 RepID=A0A841HWD7_9DEIO|nr:type 4a pilus biogenesis protein PilO [Deinobacterium chartae]MBB6097707.1 type IV pilus assembly protein PilO [Deinobacterium chartae]
MFSKVKLKQRDVALIVIVVTALAAMGWYFGMYQPTLTTNQSLQDELDIAQLELVRTRAAAASLGQLREAVAQLEEQQARFLRALPETAEFGRLLADLRSSVLASGATLVSVSQSEAQGASLPAGVRPIGVSLSLEGSFDAIYRVLQSIERLERFSTINALSINLPGEVTSFDPQLSSQLGLTVYTFDPQAATPATTETAPAAPAAPATPEAPAGGTQ